MPLHLDVMSTSGTTFLSLLLAHFIIQRANFTATKLAPLSSLHLLSIWLIAYIYYVRLLSNALHLLVLQRMFNLSVSITFNPDV